MRPTITALTRVAAILFATGIVAPTPAFSQEQTDGTFIGDVPYVATPQDVVDSMLDLAKVGPGDYVIDLGSGDGRLVVTAAKRGAEGYGVDLDPKRIAESIENARKAGVSDRAQFFQRDLFETDFVRATVLTMYLLPSVNLRLRPTILNEMKPGTRIVSHDFDMGDWKPDQFKDLGTDQVYFWLVPAKVEGSWTAKVGPDSYKLDLTQKFQEVSGTATMSGKTLKVDNGRLAGENFTFELVDGGNRRVMMGKVSGGNITGKDWSATKG